MSSTGIDGEQFFEIVSAATAWLEKSAEEINALNVFPVPDGDSGTNMLMTMRAGLHEAARSSSRDLHAIVGAISHGTFLGARGNSGVLLSRIWRGIAEGLGDRTSMNGADLSRALSVGADAAYKGLSDPVEGTILTVMREAALAAQSSIDGTGVSDPVSIMEVVVAAAREAVADTPNMLAVLKEAGVVDAGGQGLCTLFEGILLSLKGDIEQLRSARPRMVAYKSSMAEERLHDRVGPDDGPDEPYGYCTEFVLQGEGLDPDTIRGWLDDRGRSLIVVGDGSAVRVHIHAVDPSEVIHYAVSQGTIHNVSIRNMDEQYRDFLEMRRQRSPSRVSQAVVAVSPGAGLDEVFLKLGATAVIPGGQTMNPSAGDILASIKGVPSQNVIILPNNKNIMAAARQAQSLTEKRTALVPAESVPQGVTALLAFDPNNNFETNVELMTEARSQVATVEITRAIRPARLNGVGIKKDQLIGLVDGELVAAGDSAEGVMRQALDDLEAERGSIITVYHGNGTDGSQAERLAEAIRRYDASFEVEVVHGGQAGYEFIVSIE